jgi:hypothetical protein
LLLAANPISTDYLLFLGTGEISSVYYCYDFLLELKKERLKGLEGGSVL